MKLVERDRIENGGSGVLQARPGHVLHERYPSALHWLTPDEPTTGRVAATIGDIHYHHGGAWAPWNPLALDEHGEIDLAPVLSARQGVARTVYACGYAVDWHADLSATIARGGASVTLAPLALCWTNARGQRQVIGTPRPGLPVETHEDGLWVRDAFGPGLDYGIALWPDMARPVVRIADPVALLAHPLLAPRIDPAGLALTKVIGLGWDSGQPAAVFPRQPRWRRQAGALQHGEADEEHQDPGVFALHHARGPALWFHEGRAWDSAQGWALTQVWRRYGDAVQVELSLPVEAVAEASGALMVDTTMATQQVGAGGDDAHSYGATYPGTTSFDNSSTSTNGGASFSTFYCAGQRFSNPIPQGATVNTSYLSVNAAASYTSVASHLIIDCESANDPAGYENTTPNWPGIQCWSRRTGTPADWQPGDWTLSNWYQTSDVSVPLQVQVSLAGYTAQHTSFLLANFNSTPPGVALRRNWRTYEYSDHTKAAKFDATYSTSTTWTLSGTAAALSSSAVSVRRVVSLAGTGAAQSGSVVMTRRTHALTGTAAAASSEVVALRRELVLSGLAAALTGSTVTTRRQFTIGGTADALSDATLDLRRVLTLAGEAAALSGDAAAVRRVLVLTGQCDALSAAIVATRRQFGLAGEAAAGETATSLLRRLLALAGQADALSGGTVSLDTNQEWTLRGTAAALSAATVTVRRVHALAGTAAARMTVVAWLRHVGDELVWTLADGEAVPWSVTDAAAPTPAWAASDSAALPWSVADAVAFAWTCGDRAGITWLVEDHLV